jgi:hypothetical protein
MVFPGYHLSSPPSLSPLASPFPDRLNSELGQVDQAHFGISGALSTDGMGAFALAQGTRWVRVGGSATAPHPGNFPRVFLFHKLWSFSLQTSLGNGSSLDAFFPVSRL